MILESSSTLPDQRLAEPTGSCGQGLSHRIRTVRYYALTVKKACLPRYVRFQKGLR